MNSYMTTSETDDDFSKARHKALFNEVQHFLNPDETTLISLSDIKKLLKPENEVYKGMMTIPVKLIVGSEGRYNDFDNQFFPKSMHLKTRWEHIDMAHIKDIPLPPISLYELGGLYFVRDGNHRVSVAKAKGIEFIDAEVVSLQSEIKLKPGDSLKKMTKQVINYEKRVFYSETGFGDATEYWSLDFSVPGQYDVIYNHILTHKYYINMNKSDEIGMDLAMQSWLYHVYLPVIKVIDRYKIMRYFRHRTKSDLYVWMIKYWDEIKGKFGEQTTLDDIATPFLRTFGESEFRHLRNKLKGLLFKKKIKVQA
ncbi:transcriptional regulator [Treponema sp.]|uniref:transcriptional regulator n=1 Tax=Treponema sp. TaxID=166 RepID=UPI0025F52404|nr:transcriptional regulator [Treponema sp.]MBQ7537418.1 transcriptional regulator [Treponema sp.]MBR4323787.1 transcriptional regulator [Treponema sp.]